jgi:hypothetical protein|tara:strand:- start:2833 stop:5253 length:2421 start_codon:yes stop_codon:yes gene_type:complete
MSNTPYTHVSGFPDQLALDEEKVTSKYGLNVGKAIEAEWFKKEGGTSKYYSNRSTFHKLRTYALGEQSVQKYKDELAVNGDISYLNLDWTPVPIIPKMVDIVVNGMTNRLFSVKAEAVDPVSSSKKALYKNDVETQMKNKDNYEELEKMFGNKMFSMNPDELPENDDELSLHMSLNYKDEIEIGAEKAVTNVFKINEYDLLKQQLAEDATTLGISVSKHTFNIHDGIKLDYVDPSNFIHSPTEDPHFKDCYYFGEVKNVNITELKKVNPSLTQDDIKEISKLSSKWDSYQGVRGGTRTDNFDKNTATLLYFCYKSDMEIVYKKKKNAFGGDKVLEKNGSFNPPKTETARFEKLSKRIDVWYEGVLVLGTNYILKWDLMKNMVRPKSAIQKVLAPFVVSAPKMYRGNIDSLVKRMIPFADQIQLIHLKLQQITSRMIPDGVYLDVDGLASVNLGNGNSYDPQEALNLYFQTGSVIGRSSTEDGEYNHGKIPVQELTSSGANAKISSLINMYNYNLNMVRAATGLNEARDASTPDDRALVGVQKLAALNSNTATRHVLNSTLYMTTKMAQCVYYRLSDALQYSDMAEDLAKGIGKYSIDILDQIKHLHLHDFSIYIELHPDAEEKAVLEQNIQASLAAGKIDIDDAIDVRGVPNVKIASQLLKVRKKRKEKLDMKKQQSLIEQQSQSNAKAAQVAEQAKQKTLTVESQADAQIEQLKAQLEMQRMEKEFELKKKLIEMQNSMESQSKQEQREFELGKEGKREDRKDKRTEKQASQQSVLIKQRQQDLDPVDFDGQDSLGSGIQGMIGS